MKPTVEMIVNGLLTQGYFQVGGSEVFRILQDKDGQQIKVYYNDYNDPQHITIYVCRRI